MTRKQTLASMRTAGYHTDKKTFTRLLIESRIDYKPAAEAWMAGKIARANGVRCNCVDCAAEVRS